MDGVELYQVGEGIAFHGVKTKAESVRVIGRVGFSSHPHIDHFRFLKERTRLTPKMTIPAPGVLHFRQGRRSISKEVYPDLDAFFDDVANAYRRAVRAFFDAGCRYLQLDDTTWSMMCDERELAHSRERGDEPAKLSAAYARMINRALEGKPATLPMIYFKQKSCKKVLRRRHGTTPRARLLKRVSTYAYRPNNRSRPSRMVNG